MLLVATIALSSSLLIILIRKHYLSLDGQQYRKVAVRRFSVSFAIALALYLSYRLEVDNQWLYLVALPTVWLVATAVFWRVVNYLDNREKQNAASQVVQPASTRNYTQQSPVDRIYAWQDANS